MRDPEQVLQRNAEEGQSLKVPVGPVEAVKAVEKKRASEKFPANSAMPDLGTPKDQAGHNEQ